MLLPPQEDEQSGHHADSGQAKSPAPTIDNPQNTAGQRRQQRAEIDAHVEQGETRIPTWIVNVIERANYRRNIRLQITHPGNDKRE